MRRVVAVPCGALMLLATTQAVAQTKTTVAVLSVESVGIPAAQAEKLNEAIKDRIRESPAYRLVAGKSLDEVKLVFGCVDESPACMAKAGRSLGSDRLIWGALKRSGAGLTVTLKWFSVPDTKIDKFLSEDISAQDLEPENITAAVRRLTRSILVTDRGELTLSSTVSGAQIILDGRVVGQTDAGAPVALKDIPTGSHVVRAIKDGYVTWTRNVMLEGGDATAIDLVLTPAAGARDVAITSPPTARDSGKSGWRIAFWSSAGATVALWAAMAVTGYTVLGLESDKENAIVQYRIQAGNPTAFSGDDACADPAIAASAASAIKQVCDKGDARATITNVLLGVAIAATATSGFFYYKAYVEQEEPDRRETDAGDSESGAASIRSRATAADRGLQMRLTPSAGPSSAGLGLQLEF